MMHTTHERQPEHQGTPRPLPVAPERHRDAGARAGPGASRSRHLPRVARPVRPAGIPLASAAGNRARVRRRRHRCSRTARRPAGRDHGDRGRVPGRRHGGSFRQQDRGRTGAARRDCESGKPILPVLLLETGGVRLQEANLGEAVVAEIHAEIIALRRLVPVIGVITGMIGCFGGMSITAGLCSYLVVFPQARLELNGPEVIEQEAGIDELDASDKHLIWSLMGGEQRYETGFVDALIEDDAKALRADHPGPGGTAAFLPGIGARRLKSTGAGLAKIDPAAPPDGTCAAPDLAERRDAMSTTTPLIEPRPDLVPGTGR